MNLTSIAPTTHPLNLVRSSSEPPPQLSDKDKRDDEVREKFQEWAGQTFYGTLLKEMRKTISKPAYMHGGRTEEVFQTQLDQVLVEKMSEATADTFSDPMYELFVLNGSKGR